MKQKIYKIKFFQVGEVYEIYAKNIYQSDFYAFLEIDGYIFDDNNFLILIGIFFITLPISLLISRLIMKEINR